MRILFFVCLLFATNAFGQTKQEAEDLLSCYLNKYFNTNYDSSSMETSTHNMFGNYEYSKCRFTFKLGFFLIYEQQFEISGMSRRAFLLHTDTTAICLTRIDNVSNYDSEQSGGAAFISTLKLKFINAGTTLKDAPVFKIQKGESENGESVNGFNYAPVFLPKYTLESTNKNVLNYNIAGTIVKTFNYLIDLYKESFNGRFNDDVNTHNNPSWFYLGKIREGESIYISSKCVSNNLGIIKAWIKITNDTIKYNGVIYKNCQEENLYLINRNEEKIRTIETICYSSSGKVIYDNGQEENETEWLNVPPDSMGEIIYNSACAIFNSKN